MKAGKKVRCDVCEKIIRTKKFRQILIYITNYEKAYIDGHLDNCEKELDVCNSCIFNLNFREYKQKKSRRVEDLQPIHFIALALIENGAEVFALHTAKALKEVQKSHPELLTITKPMGGYSGVERMPYFRAILTAQGKKLIEDICLRDVEKAIRQIDRDKRIEALRQKKRVFRVRNRLRDVWWEGIASDPETALIKAGHKMKEATANLDIREYTDKGGWKKCKKI